eukprot:5728039-Pleurochrysis_carterae.AAC.2
MIGTQYQSAVATALRGNCRECRYPKLEHHAKMKQETERCKGRRRCSRPDHVFELSKSKRIWY